MPHGRSLPLSNNSSLGFGLFLGMRAQPKLHWDPQLAPQLLPAEEGSPEMYREDTL